jgi:hypothetical protein
MALILSLQVREAYVALGYRPERQLYTRMEAAGVRERNRASALRKRESDALVEIAAAERQVARDRRSRSPR